jgi:hypothetical protein
MAVLISTQLVDVPIFFPIFYSVDGCPHLYHLFQLVDVPIFSIWFGLPTPNLTPQQSSRALCKGGRL